MSALSSGVSFAFLESQSRADVFLDSAMHENHLASDLIKRGDCITAQEHTDHAIQQVFKGLNLNPVDATMVFKLNCAVAIAYVNWATIQTLWADYFILGKNYPAAYAHVENAIQTAQMGLAWSPISEDVELEIKYVSAYARFKFATVLNAQGSTLLSQGELLKAKACCMEALRKVEEASFLIQPDLILACDLRATWAIAKDIVQLLNRFFEGE